jgi:hypothetical protein
VADAGAERSHRPWALASDVALLRAVSKHALSEATMEAAQNSEIAPQLVTAASEVRFGTEPDA